MTPGGSQLAKNNATIAAIPASDTIITSRLFTMRFGRAKFFSSPVARQDHKGKIMKSEEEKKVHKIIGFVALD
jgi:hypothetical protein